MPSRLSPRLHFLAAVALIATACGQTPTDPGPSSPELDGVTISSTQTLLVTPTDMNGWGFLVESGTGGTGSLLVGPTTPPLGNGSLNLAVPGATDGIILGMAYPGTRLDAIDDFSYSTYRTSGGPALAIALQLNIDTDVTDTDESWQGRLVYEPYHAHTVLDATWQAWDPRDDAPNGNWWFSGAPGNTVCPQSNPCTWSEVLTAFPDAGIHATLGGILFKAGSGWTGFDGNVDAFTISVSGAATTWDFEPYAPCTFTTSGTTMTLDGDCTTDETIFVPDGFTLEGAGHTITAIDPPAGHFLGAVVQNQGAIAHVTHLGVTTNGLANTCDGGGSPDNRLRGILFEGASGSITNNVVTNINQGFSGCQEGNAIEVRNAPFDGTHPATTTVLVTGNTIEDYQKTGILANGDVEVEVSGNSVDGLGPVPNIAQNGIQIGFGATGDVMDNAIAGSWFTGAGWVSTGILVFQASDVTVNGNAVSGSQSGVAVETWCFLGAPAHASDNRVMKNDVMGADFGITVSAFDFFSSCDPFADNNKVVNNTITDPEADGQIGVFVGTGDAAGGFTPTASNNKVINNEIAGYVSPIEEDGDGTKIHANKEPAQ